MNRQFPNGDLVTQDARLDDPLIYVVPRGDWSHSLGFKFDSWHELYYAAEASSHLWNGHLKRVAELSDGELARCVEQLALALAEEFPRWRRWRTEFPPAMVQRLGAERIRDSFQRGGWTPESQANDQTFVWASTRPQPTGPTEPIAKRHQTKGPTGLSDLLGHFYWSLNSVPELRGLSAAERRDAVRKVQSKPFDEWQGWAYLSVATIVVWLWIWRWTLLMPSTLARYAGLLITGAIVVVVTHHVYLALLRRHIRETHRP